MTQREYSVDEVRKLLGRKKRGSIFDREGFSLACRGHGIPEPVYEHRFHDTRSWELDVAWPEHKLAVESNGGIWINGGHNRGSGLLREYEKFNNAVLCGWRVLHFSSQQIVNGDWIPFVKQVLEEQ